MLGREWEWERGWEWKRDCLSPNHQVLLLILYISRFGVLIHILYRYLVTGCYGEPWKPSLYSSPPIHLKWAMGGVSSI